MDQEHCSTLDNMVSTYADASKFTDTLPSISIDDNSSLSDNDFFLKEHYDKIDKLRKENFDLKLKLYLLESNEKITNDSELKFKVLNEFEKKNEEIKHLKARLKSQCKENDNLKKLAQNQDNQAIDQVRSKLSEAIEICFNLVKQSEQLIRMNRKFAKAGTQIDELNSSQAYLEKASRFLSDNSSALLTTDGNGATLVNGIGSGDKATDNSPKETRAIHITAHNHSNESIEQSNLSASQPEDLIISKLTRNASKDKHMNIIDEFMKVMEKLRNLIDDFRANKLTYKIFSTRLDSLFEELNIQYKLLERLQRNKEESEAQLRRLESMLKNETTFKEKIKLDLSKNMEKIDLIILKAKQSL